MTRERLFGSCLTRKQASAWCACGGLLASSSQMAVPISCECRHTRSTHMLDRGRGSDKDNDRYRDRQGRREEREC